MNDDTERLPQDENHAQQLMQQAFACLDRQDLNGATQAARQLEQMRHSAAFEIMAEVNMMAGHPARAIEILEDGIKHAPTVWLLWQSLGNAYAHTGQFEKAQVAYGKTLQCPGADTSSVHFNRGMAFARDRRYPEAMDAFDLVTSDLLRYKAASFKLALCNDMNCFDEAARGARALLEEEISDPEDRARVHSALARALMQGSNDGEGARRHADIALKIWPNEPTARMVLGVLDRPPADS